MDVLSKHGLLCVMCVISSVWFPQGCGGDSGRNEGRKLTLSVCASLDPCVCVCVCVQGKRKSSKKPPPKKKVPKLATTFACPFCNHPSSVSAKRYE